MIRALSRPAALALALLLAVPACSSFEAGINRPSDDRPQFDVYFRIPSASSDASARRGPALSVNLTDEEGNTLELTEGQLVVREMELVREGGECVDAGSPTRDDGDDCYEISVDPQLLTLPVNRSDLKIVDGFPVEQVSFDGIEFDLRRASATDQQVLARRPQLRDHSVHLRGSYNGEDFSIVLPPEGTLSLDFDQVVAAEEDVTSEITLVAEMDGWFRADDGSLLDPRQVEEDGTLEERVSARILGSFSVENGAPDGGS